MIKKIYHSVFFRFLVIGGLGTLSNLIIFYLLADILRVEPILSAVVAFIAAVSQNYVLNHYWSFRQVVDYPASFKAFLKYTGVNFVGLLINLVVLKFIIVYFSPDPKATAQLIGIAFGTIASYFGAKHFVFLGKNV